MTDIHFEGRAEIYFLPRKDKAERESDGGKGDRGAPAYARDLQTVRRELVALEQRAARGDYKLGSPAAFNWPQFWADLDDLLRWDESGPDRVDRRLISFHP